MDEENGLAKETSSLHIADSPGASPSDDQPTHQQNGSYKPKASRMRGPTVRDITQEFTKAASDLKTGELVKDEYFTLFESVGALEIMDPKMDSGYLAPGETLDDDYDVLRDLLPEEVIGIMDQMLCYEMAWHMGYPLAQSLFTSLYLDRLLWPEPRTLEEARFDRGSRPVNGQGRGDDEELLHTVLRAFCLGLVKACDLVYETVSSEHYYEEEDFVLSLYNRSLLARFEVDEILKILDEAHDTIRNSFPKLPEVLKKALSTRLEIRRTFLAAVDFGHSNHKETIRDWETCNALLPVLKTTHHLGKPVEGSFSVKLQRKLASTVPPRAVVVVNFDDAWDIFSRICHGGESAYRILDYHGGTWLQNFIWSFQSRTPQPPAYIRCLLQSLIFNDMKVLDKLSLKQLLFDDLEEITLPADILVDDTNSGIEAPQDPRFQIAKKMDEFVQRAADVYIDMFRTLCMNRSRLRRMLCHLVLDWDSLQFDAENADLELREFTNEEPIRDEEETMWSFPLSSWVYYHKLQQLEWIVQMGFELAVYKVDELGGMYWYLQHLAQTRQQHLERIRTFTNARIARIPTPTREQLAALRRSLNFLDFATLHAYATQSFASGLSSLYACLAHLNLLPGPHSSSPYGTPQLRYALRMRPFLAISLPEVPTYDQFLANVSMRPPDPNASSAKIAAQAMSMLNVAERAFKSARKDWEAISRTSAEKANCQGSGGGGSGSGGDGGCESWWRDGVKDVLRSTIMGGIAVATTKKALNAATDVEEMRERVNVRVPPVGGGGGEGDGESEGEARTGKTKGNAKIYHAWWIIPEVSAK